jgi:hypothetical protein
MAFTVFDLPPAHRTRLRTTNGLERINRELKRRTRVASIFPNTAALLRLVSALLAECDEEWDDRQNLPQPGGFNSLIEMSRLESIYRKQVALPPRLHGSGDGLRQENLPCTDCRRPLGLGLLQCEGITCPGWSRSPSPPGQNLAPPVPHMSCRWRSICTTSPGAASSDRA